MRSPLMLAAALCLPVLLGACAIGMAPDQYISRVRIGQSASLGTVRLVPLQLIEDSRCPASAECASPGQLRLRVSVQQPNGLHQRTMTLGRPELISGGTLLLDDALPEPSSAGQPSPSEYRFTFRFTVPRTH